MIEAWNDTPNHLPKDNIRLHKKHYQKLLIKQTYPDAPAEENTPNDD